MSKLKRVVGVLVWFFFVSFIIGAGAAGYGNLGLGMSGAFLVGAIITIGIVALSAVLVITFGWILDG